MGPNGKPLVDFPIPRGPVPEALMGVGTDPGAMQEALWKGSLELRDGVRACRDLLKAMRLEDVRVLEELSEEDVGTVRVSKG